MKVSRVLAPEDIRVGDYISVLHIIGEHLPTCLEDASWRRTEPLRVRWLPWSVTPVRVIDVCLPYVLVRGPSGRHGTLDVRRYELTRVPKSYGREVFRRLREDRRRARQLMRKR